MEGMERSDANRRQRLAVEVCVVAPSRSSRRFSSPPSPSPSPPARMRSSYWAESAAGPASWMAPSGVPTSTDNGEEHNFIFPADEPLDNPCGVAVDGAHIYWVNPTDTLGVIGRANLNGSGRTRTSSPLPASLAVPSRSTARTSTGRT